MTLAAIEAELSMLDARRAELVRARFDALLKQSEQIVSKWPKWKQNVLGDSMQPHGPPRQPVSNDEELHRAVVAQRRYA